MKLLLIFHTVITVSLLEINAKPKNFRIVYRLHEIDTTNWLQCWWLNRVTNLILNWKKSNQTEYNEATFSSEVFGRSKGTQEIKFRLCRYSTIVNLVDARSMFSGTIIYSDEIKFSALEHSPLASKFTCLRQVHGVKSLACLSSGLYAWEIAAGYPQIYPTTPLFLMLPVSGFCKLAFHEIPPFRGPHWSIFSRWIWFTVISIPRQSCGSPRSSQ